MTACRQVRRRRQFHREPRQPPRNICPPLRLLKFKQILSFLTRNLQEAALIQKNTTLFYSCLHRNTCLGDTKSQRYTHHAHCACQLCPRHLTGTVTQVAAHSLCSLGSCTVPRMPGELLLPCSAAFFRGQVWSTYKKNDHVNFVVGPGQEKMSWIPSQKEQMLLSVSVGAGRERCK